MTALLWMLAWLPQVLPALSKLPQPVNVTLVSRHFIHMLKWEPGPGTPTGVHYHVAVNTYTGTSFVPVVGCERVQHPLICNLTEAFCDRKQVYYTRITALLEGQGSTPLTLRGFKPINDTHLDLPLLTVTPCAEGLCVDLRPPMEHLREVYDLLNYKLRIKSNNADKPQFFMSTKSLSRQILKDLASGRQYCVSVCFSHGLVSRESNYSHAVCASTPGHYTADPWISTALCLLVVLGVVIGALLVYTGFTGLLRRPLPLVLTSIHHLEELLFIPSCNTSLLSSLVNGEPTAPSSGEKRSNQTCDESDGQSETESTGGSRGGAYKMRLGNNLLSSSSSSSSSLSDPLPPEPEPLIPTDTHSNAGLNKAQSTHTDASPASGSVSGTGGPVPPNTEERKVVQEGGSRDVFHTQERKVVQEGGSRDVFHTQERKVVQEGGSRDVDLLTLTFGRLGEEEEEEEVVGNSRSDFGEMEPESSSASELCNTIPTKEAVIGTVSCSVDEEEEEEHCGYMGRP